MVHTLVNVFKITTSQTANFFIFYFKRIPLLGRILSDKIYKDNSLKTLLAALIYIITLVFKFFTKALYLFIFIILPFLLAKDIIPKSLLINGGIQIFICLNFCIGALHDPHALKKDKNKYLSVILMGMRSKDYCISTLLYTNVLFFIAFLPSIIITSLVANLSVLKGIMLLVMLMCARMGGQCLHLMVFSKTKKLIHTKWSFAGPLYIIFILLSYPLVFLNIVLDWESVLLNPIGLLVALVIGVLSLRYLFKYPNYRLAVEQSSKREELIINTKQVTKEAMFAQVKLKDSDLNLEKEKRVGLNKKEGYDYLNAIFFQRHRRMLVKPIFIRVLIVILLFVILATVLVILPIEDKRNIIKTIFSSLNVFVFGMYMIATGDKMSKAMFFNCDISLLRYGFYRQKDVIITNFWIRLKKAIWFNLVPALSLCSALVGLLAISGQPIDGFMLVPFLASILCLSVFFSVHHIFMYYVFQPYTTELDVKNPFFKVINGVVYFACFISLQIDSPPHFFVWIVLISTVLYIVAALVLVRMFAPKTFRVK